jgi:acetylornithine deacetylase/succinyl-diaminopimelate desuccinylase-like protein
MSGDLTVVRRRREAEGGALLESYAGLLAIPAGDPAGLDRSAVWIRDTLNELGARAAVTQIPGIPPLVFGRIDGEPGGPTFGLYGRFDSAAPGRRPGLEADGVEVDRPVGSDPIDPGWRILGEGPASRATVGSLIVALTAGAAGRRASLVFLLEGEGSRGSPHLPDYLSLLAGRLAADLWVACEGAADKGRMLGIDDPTTAAAGLVQDAVAAAAAERPEIGPVPGDPAAIGHLAGLSDQVAVIPISDLEGLDPERSESLRVSDLWFGGDLLAALLG